MTQYQDFNFNVDLLRCILWQYNDAERLQSLIKQKQEWLIDHHTDFWAWWVKNVFDLRTASDFGLAVWGIILEESREVFMSAARPGYPAFGFGEYRKNFGKSNFRRLHDGYTKLALEQYRLLLQLRYFKLISRGTVSEINAFLKMLFQGQGRVFVLDPLDMSFAVYVFTFSPTSMQKFVLDDMDALPRPAGVGAQIRIVSRQVFGFGPDHLNFRGGFAETKRSE